MLPGVTLVCPDSHTCSQGELGALAWGIGSTEAEHALATGTLRAKKPRRMRITIDGELATGVTAKDLALHILQRIGSAGDICDNIEIVCNCDDRMQWSFAAEKAPLHGLVTFWAQIWLFTRTVIYH